MNPDRSYLAMPSDIQQELNALLPGFDQIVERCANSLQPFVHQFIGSDEVGEAHGIIVTQAINDFLDLLFDASCGRGRPALRAARSLFEHVATLKDVDRDQTEADRYLAHLVVGQYWQSCLALPKKALSGKSLKSFSHRQKKLGIDVKKPLAAAMRLHGRAFMRQWSKLTLRDRVSRNGMTEHWPFYALSSTVLHGAAGGVIGLVDFETFERPVHRTGPALELCPIAFLYGVEFFELLLKQCNSVLPRSADAPLDALADLLVTWDGYRQAILKIDSELWPKMSPTPMTAVVQILHGGKRRWWLRDDNNNRVARANPPTKPLSSAQEKSIKIVISKMSPLSDPVTITLPGVNVAPKVPLKWEHAGRLLVQMPLGGWETMGPINPTNPRRLDA
jgi:hypothetical protein